MKNIDPFRFLRQVKEENNGIIPEKQEVIERVKQLMEEENGQESS